MLLYTTAKQKLHSSLPQSNKETIFRILAVSNPAPSENREISFSNIPHKTNFRGSLLQSCTKLIKKIIFSNHTVSLNKNKASWLKQTAR